MPYTPRTWQTILNQLLASKAAQSALNGLTSTSAAAYWRLMLFIDAVSTNLLEQIWSLLVAQIETTVSKAVPGTPAWIQAQVLAFQYGNVIQINPDFTFGYPAPAQPLIITSAAVQVGSSGQITIKVAQGGSSPTPLTGGQITSLQSYLSAILPAGQFPQIISATADKLQVNAIVYYNGQYNSTIQTAVQTALTNYMSLIPFNGVVRVSDVERVILSVTGVVDVTISQITITPSSGSPVNLVLGSQELARSSTTYAGYVVNDVSNPFSTTITYQVAQQ